MEHKTENHILTLIFPERIDTTNANNVEEEINAIIEDSTPKSIIIDAENLEFISSAGLRVILRLIKKFSDMRIINVSSDVYEIFDMTGFTEMTDIEKAYRNLSVAGCEEIGSGSNSNVYRIAPDTIIKVYKDTNALEDIKNERALARKAFVLGIPTAIPYDVVKVDGTAYGSVFELLEARPLSEVIAEDNENFDHYISLYIELLKKIHKAELKPGELPDMKRRVIGWADDIKDELPDELWAKLADMLNAIPEDNHMLHADYQVKNVMLQNGETLLIDMDTLCMGHPIFEFACMYMSYIGFDEATPENVLKFLGFPMETSINIWKKSIAEYFGTEDEKALKDIENKAIIIGYVRLLRRTLSTKKFTVEPREARIERCKKHLIETIPLVDSLYF